MQLRFLICIPTYNHPRTVVEVAQECLKVTNFPILIVDDGSEVSVQDLFAEKSNRIKFISHNKNLGKGAALRSGFKYAVDNDFTHVISIDADGQHPAVEIPKLVAEAYKKPWALILGDRKMQTSNVPASSIFGKKFSNFWVKYETGKPVGDSQSGFRIYPLFFVQQMKFISSRYDFEVEVLTRLLWRGVEIKSVPVEVKYFSPDKRVTHFHKLKDNFRLTVLNTILVSTSLLRRQDPPFKSALAVALGVFVGCFPVYGLHTLIVAIFSFIFRMNFIYLWLGTQISIPPMVPLLVMGAYFFSSQVVGHPPQGIFALSLDWLVGILSLAIILASFIGLITYVVKIIFLKKNRTEKIAVKSKDGFGIQFMQWVLKVWGLRPAYFFLWFIVPYYYLFSVRSRRAGIQYWKLVLPDNTFLEREIAYFKQLLVFAKILVDRGFQRYSEKRIFNVTEGPGISELKHDLVKSNKGSILVQSHIGGWEVAMSYFHSLSIDKKMLAIMYGIEGAYQHTSGQTTQGQLELRNYNQQQDTSRMIKAHLENGNIVGLMGDRPVGQSYELVKFMGYLAVFDTTPIRLATICKSDLHFIFSSKIGLYDYEVDSLRGVDPSDNLLNLSGEDLKIFILKKYVGALEQYVRKHPHQWFNFFEFWSEKIF